jgi:CheY-like chemotaxis protein
MPVMDGLAATREIRRTEREFGLPSANIIALTGASSVNARERAIASGVNKFFTKPVPLSVVRSFVVELEQSSTNNPKGSLPADCDSAPLYNTG